MYWTERRAEKPTIDIKCVKPTDYQVRVVSAENPNLIYYSSVIAADPKPIERPKPIITATPNPASSTLTISLNLPDGQTPCAVQLLFSTGMVAMEIPMYSHQTTLNVSDWNEGVYYVRYLCDDFAESAKVVVVR